MKNRLQTALLTAVGLMIFSAVPAAAQVPNWAVGTFYARNPYSGGYIELTIQRNGQAMANMDGAMSYGTYTRNNRLIMGGAQSRVTRRGNGITTTRMDNGERIDYTRGNMPPGYGQNYPDYNEGWTGNRVPNWAVGTFYGTSPWNGMPITLTISANGRVNAYIGTGSSYGSLNGNILTIDGAQSRITRSGRGIVTTRLDNRERIEYTRDRGSIWRPLPGQGGMQGDVPNWAVGTWYARNPQTGGTITMTISSNGSVAIIMDEGYVEYGSMYRDRLTFQGITSEVDRIRNGIRTTRQDNGERINYYRNRR